MQASRTSHTSWPWRQVAITGASSGLGRALALACAAPGVVLHLAGRDAARLAATAAAARAAGADARGTLFDIRDATAAEHWIVGAGPLDLVLANAGMSGGTGIPGSGGMAPEAAAGARAVFETNLIGVLNTVLPAREAMAAQPAGRDGVRGRIGVVASVGAFVAAPGAPAYAASKAAVQRWTEALDALDRQRGVRLHAICPGYVRTPMTAQNRFVMPLLLSPERAAQLALRGIARGRVRIAYPWPIYAAARLIEAMPPGWRNALLTRRPAKPARLPAG